MTTKKTRAEKAVTTVTQDDLVLRMKNLARRLKMSVPEMWLMYEAGGLRGTIAECEIHMNLFLVRPRR